VLVISVNSNRIYANGVSPYLPLKTDPLIELQIERLAAITQMPVLTKPYHIVTVNNYLSKIQKSHPILFHRLNSYIKRFKKQGAITQLSTTLSHSDNESEILINGRGITNDVTLKTTASGFYQFNQYSLINFGGSIIDGEKIIPHNSYFSFGYEYLQFDIGYREHWLSPLQESSLALSTNAEPIPSITMSNVEPITDWNIKYEMSLGLLEEMNGIHFDNTTSSGQPGFLTMQLSFQLFDWWTIGGVRTFMFAGGNRPVEASTIWKAIIDPISGDNCGGESDLQDCNKESGNQIASITSKMDFSIGNFPISILAEYGGEDAKDYKYSLGNIGQTYGIFMPYVNQDLSMYIEYTKFHDRWYVHHLYDEGYRNDGSVMGHWWGNNKALNDKSPGNAALLRLNWDISQEMHLQTILKTAKIDAISNIQYSRSKEIQVTLKKIQNHGFMNYSVSLGKDIYDASYYRLSVGYNW